MDISYIVNPLVTSGVVALVAGLGLLWLVWSSRAGMASLLKKLFTRTAFFWLVNIVFMAISAYHAAPFFGNVVSTIPGLEGIAQYIGLPVALVIDGVTIVFMQARMEASYKRNDKNRDMYTRYVFCSALLNTVANLYTDIQHFQYDKYNGVGVLIYAAPVILSVFPMFLVAISKAADEMVNVKPFETLNVEEFEEQEKKRVEILEKQAEYLERETKAIAKLIQIEATQKQNEQLRSGKLPKSFRWPWENAIDIDSVVSGVSAQLKAIYEPQIEQLKQQLEEVKNQQSEVQFGVFIDDTVEDLGVQEVVHPQIAQPVAESTAQSADNSATPEHKTSTPKVQSVDAKKQVQKLLKKQPNLTAKQIAARAEISESYAQKLKAQIAKETAPKPRNTDELPVSNGHQKVTQPLDNLVPMEV